MVRIYNQTVDYDLVKIPLAKLLYDVIAEHVKVNYDKDLENLSSLHKFVPTHKINELYQDIYAFFRKPEFQTVYGKLGRHIVDTYYDGKGSFQKIPSLRLHFPKLKTVQYHTDEWYGHGHNSGICWVPLVDVSGTSSMYVSSPEASRQVLNTVETQALSVSDINKALSSVCEPLELQLGQAFLFNAHLVHGAEINQTNDCRVSFDFRIRPFGESDGTKSDDFFETPDQFDAKTNTPTSKQIVGVVYVNMHEGFTKYISQKTQQLMCLQYAEEKNIFVLSAETEIVTMSHYPMLFDLLEQSEGRECDVIVLFSVLLLPKDEQVRSKLFSLARKQGIALAFAAEALTFPAHGTVEDEAAILQVRLNMISAGH